MNIFLNNDIDEKIVLNDLEQELYDALIDEYNDIFENILNISEKNLFDTIINNVRAIFGEKKMKSFSKITMARSLSTLKINNYMQDFLSLKNIKEMILSLGNKDINKKIPELKIDEIYAHCKDCSKCYHTCGEILLNPPNQNYLFCLKCKQIYKKDLIHLFCKECNEEYYSYIIDYNEPIYEDYFPATWDKYHCPNFICEEMVCPECDSMLYYNDKKKILKCFGCRWTHLLKDMVWKCELCDKEFSSGVKEYVKFETKPLVNCVRNALVNKIPARPAECLCCGAEPRLYLFKHLEKKCKGVLYLGYLQKKEMAICSICRLVQNLKEVKWVCPKCGDFFYCNKIKNGNKRGNENRKNNYLLKPIASMENEQDKYDNKLQFKEMKMKMAGASSRNTEMLNKKQTLMRGKSFSKKVVYGLFCDERDKIRKENKRIPTSRLVNNINLIKKDSNENNESNSRNNFEIKEEDEFDINPKIEFKSNNDNIHIMNNNSNSNNNINLIRHTHTNNFEKLSSYILSKKGNNNPKMNKSSKNIILLNQLKTPMIIGDKKLKFFVNNHSSQKDITKKGINNNNSRFLQNQQFINYNKELLKNNNEKYSHINGNNNINNKNNFMPKSDKNISLNLQININNINFNNVPLDDNNDNYINKRTKTATLSGRFENKFNLNKNDNIKKILENDYENEIDIEPDENFIPEDFDIIKQIGEGTFGKIFCIEWPKNKKKYAMKKMILRTMEELNINQEKTNILFNFIKKTNSNGVIRLYGDQCEQKNEAEYIYYVLMELANIDWENEIKKRSESKKFYTEGELMEILNQLISSFALLQKNNITHRDIKPQNILIANNKYKICDFGEAKIIQTDGVIQQSIRGTELYMSPILFKALNSRQKMVVHNTYKSDVFSLGMCILLAATLTYQSLYDIRELDNMENVKNILVKYLIAKYSYNFVGTLLKMLEVKEDLRPDFIQLEDSIRNF